MLQYLLRRLVNMVITLLAISILTFAIIQLPPGDYVSTQIAQMTSLAMGCAIPPNRPDE